MTILLSHLFSVSISARARCAVPILVLALLLGCAANPWAPTPQAAPTTPSMAQGVAFERNLVPGSQDEVPLDLKADLYVRVSFETPSQDLAVKLVGPGGEVLSETAGSDGRLALITAAAGTYRVVFDAQEPRTKGFSYRFTLLDSRPGPPRDEARGAAERS